MKTKQRVERSSIVVDGVPVDIDRKPIRTLRLGVRPPDGRVRVAAPFRVTDHVVREFVTAKLAWIRKHQARIASLPRAVPPVPLSGEHRERLREQVLPLIAMWEAVLGVRVATWRIRRMKSRWGSCNVVTRRVSFSLELARHPVHCIEYVVVHELAHLIEASHGPKFVAIMDRHLPDWRARRRELNAVNGGRPACP